MIVVDANVIIYMVYETSFSPLARQVHAADPDWVVPDLWEAEVLNGLMNELRAGHTRLDDVIEAARNTALLVAGKSHRCDRTTILRTADEARLTAYDAYYVALARALGVKLVTEDGRIQKHCKDVARSLKVFLGLPEEPTAVREHRTEYRTRRKA